MGNTKVYYKRILQQFAYNLEINNDNHYAKSLLKEKLEKTLEEYILDKKEEITKEEFYYKAGKVSQYVLDEAYKEGCGAINAAIKGLNEFEKLIGISKE